MFSAANYQPYVSTDILYIMPTVKILGVCEVTEEAINSKRLLY